MSALIQESPTLNAQFGKAPTPADMLSLIRSFGGTFTRGSEVIGDPTPETLSASTYTDNLGVIRRPRVGYPRPNFVDGVNKGVLIEEQRTNNWTHSENFSDSSWVKTRATITANQAIAPDGEMTADLYTATGDDARLDKSSIAGQRVLSFFIKRAGSSDVACTLDFSGLAAKSVTATNQWQRVDNFLDNATGFSGRIRIVNNGDAIYIWGAQLEAGSFPTSYIPTAGSTVTRGKESLNSLTASDKLGQEGTVLIVCDLGSKATRAIINLSVDSTNPALRTQNRLALDLSNPTTLSYRVIDGNVVQSNISGSFTAGKVTIALVYKENLFKMFINGAQAGSTDTSGTVPDFGRIYIGQNILNDATLNDSISQLTVIPKALTDAQLQLLSRI